MHIYLYVRIPDRFVNIMQITQQIYVAEKWVRKARDKVNAEAHSRANAEKMLGALEEENRDLANKLKKSDKERQNALAGLKNAEAQAEDQCKLLYTTKRNLAIEKQKFLDLKLELERNKEAAWLAREAAEATMVASYEHRVLDMRKRLAKEVAVVCRDYVAKS